MYLHGEKTLSNRTTQRVAPSPLGPGPRGLIVRSLKQGPKILSELVRDTDLAVHQVYYFLQTLAARGLIRESRAIHDHRCVIYTLTTQQEPTSDPTPAIAPLNDPYVWQTWFE